jgi:predicted DNA-binding transcriptional regulator AlpA
MPLDLVGAPEIADLLGVTRRSAWRYVGRPDFPAPVAELKGKRLWQRRAVEKWAAKTLPLPLGPRPRSGRRS